jgi:hypothetical protein
MKLSALPAIGFVTVFLTTGCVEDMPRPERPRPERPMACTQEYAPVCAVKPGKRKTFSNACMARAAGYTVVSGRACNSTQ